MRKGQSLENVFLIKKFQRNFGPPPALQAVKKRVDGKFGPRFWHE